MPRICLLAILAATLVCDASVWAQPAPQDASAAILDQIKTKKITLKSSPATLQSAIDAAANELRKTSDINLVVSFDEAFANAAIADHLKTSGSKFKNPRLKLRGQSVSATIQHAGTLSLPALGTVQVQSELRAQLAPSIETNSDAGSSEFKVSFAVLGLEASHLRLSRADKPLRPYIDELAALIVDELLVPAQELLSMASVGGHCIQEWNDPACEARKVTNKGLCEARKSAEKFQCEAEKTAEKLSCEAVKEGYKRILATGADYANVESRDLALSGAGQVCLTHLLQLARVDVT